GCGVASVARRSTYLTIRLAPRFLRRLASRPFSKPHGLEPPLVRLPAPAERLELALQRRLVGRAARVGERAHQVALGVGVLTQALDDPRQPDAVGEALGLEAGRDAQLDAGGHQRSLGFAAIGERDVL